jgi:hypothetical protein
MYTVRETLKGPRLCRWLLHFLLSQPRQRHNSLLLTAQITSSCIWLGSGASGSDLDDAGRFCCYQSRSADWRYRRTGRGGGRGLSSRRGGRLCTAKQGGM